VPPVRADNDAFYAMPSVVFWEAVRSVGVDLDCDIAAVLLNTNTY